jgi:trehalose-phosphatase
MDAQPQRSTPPGFWQLVATSGARLLILDYDGTLAPFTVQRDEAHPYREVRDTLRQIAAAGHTRLVIISGRSATEVLELLSVDPPPEVWGSHGQERLVEGRLLRSPLTTAQETALDAARQAAIDIATSEAIETKFGCVAVHWRGLPAEKQQQMHASVTDAWKPYADANLQLHEFDGGLELRRTDVNKGTALGELIHEAGSPPCVAYLGDDLTDEVAFAALSGRGLTVLVRSEYRPTLAEVWLRPPEEVVRFLVAWHEAASHSRRT